MQTRLDLGELEDSIKYLPFWEDGSRMLMMNAPCEGIPKHLPSQIHRAILEIQFLTGLTPVHMMINKLPPCITVGVHTDTLTNNEKMSRWHLPIKTNEQAFFWDEEEGQKHFPLGVWSGPVKYWIPHSVYNLGDEERIHLVVDLR